MSLKDILAADKYPKTKPELSRAVVRAERIFGEPNVQLALDTPVEFDHNGFRLRSIPRIEMARLVAQAGVVAEMRLGR